MRTVLVGAAKELSLRPLETRLELRVVATAAEAQELIRSGSVDVLLVRLGENDHAGVAEVLDRHPSIPVVALVERVGVDAIEALLRRGLTDFVRLPLDMAELELRVRRIRGRVASEPRWPGLDGLPAILAGELSGYSDGCFWIAEHGSSVVEEMVAATISVTALEERAELKLTVSMSRTGANTAVARLLGTAAPEPQMVVDLLTEIANVSAGAMKRCMAACGLELTLGLPSARDGLMSTDTTVVTAFDLASDATTIRCKVTSQPATFARLPTEELREGLVVAEALRAPGGALLVAAGTRLTSSAIEQVRANLDEGALVEVIQAR